MRKSIEISRGAKLTKKKQYSNNMIEIENKNPLIK